MNAYFGVVPTHCECASMSKKTALVSLTALRTSERTSMAAPFSSGAQAIHSWAAVLAASLRLSIKKKRRAGMAARALRRDDYRATVVPFSRLCNRPRGGREEPCDE
jgi:hypothetical protein